MGRSGQSVQSTVQAIRLAGHLVCLFSTAKQLQIAVTAHSRLCCPLPDLWAVDMLFVVGGQHDISTAAVIQVRAATAVLHCNPGGPPQLLEAVVQGGGKLACHLPWLPSHTFFHMPPATLPRALPAEAVRPAEPALLRHRAAQINRQRLPPVGQDLRVGWLGQKGLGMVGSKLNWPFRSPPVCRFETAVEEAQKASLVLQLAGAYILATPTDGPGCTAVPSPAVRTQPPGSPVHPPDCTRRPSWLPSTRRSARTVALAW